MVSGTFWVPEFFGCPEFVYCPDWVYGIFRVLGTSSFSLVDENLFWVSGKSFRCPEFFWCGWG